MSFTVIDILRAWGIEPEARVTWALGAAARDAFAARYGELPAKALRTKTAGKGSHCFAVYPAHDRAFIEGVIRGLLDVEKAARLAQPSLL